MICIARTFGAPETVPAGKHARSRSNGVDPVVQSSPATSETRCVTCEKRSGSRNRSTCTVPGTQTRERSLRPRSTSITCSARSFSEASSRSASPSPGCVVPAIGFRLARPPSALTSVSGERADEREVAELEQEEVRRRVDAPQRAVELRAPTPGSAAPRAGRGRSGRRPRRGCAPWPPRPRAGTRSLRRASAVCARAGAVSARAGGSGPLSSSFSAISASSPQSTSASPVT